MSPNLEDWGHVLTDRNRQVFLVVCRDVKLASRLHHDADIRVRQCILLGLVTFSIYMSIVDRPRLFPRLVFRGAAAAAAAIHLIYRILVLVKTLVKVIARLWVLGLGVWVIAFFFC